MKYYTLSIPVLTLATSILFMASHAKSATSTNLTVVSLRGKKNLLTSKTATLRNIAEDHDHDHDHDDDEAKPWGKVFGTTLLVNVATLSGVVFLIPAISKHGCAVFTRNTSKISTEETPATIRRKKYSDLIIPAFAAGALLSTIVFLVLPEGLMALQRSFEDEHESHDRFRRNEEEEHEEHGGELLVDAVWRFGAMLLFGFLLPVVFEALFPKKIPEPEEDEEEESGDEIKKNYPLIISILTGDFLHNFCDGIFIGVAYLGCSDGVALTIVLVTLYHEIAQEIADFFLLTDHAGLTVCQALTANFVAGLSVVLGGLLSLAFDVNDFAIGLVLSLSSGTYFYIAAVECMPRAHKVVETVYDRLLTILMFMIGAIPVGLALINHSHCDEH